MTPRHVGANHKRPNYIFPALPDSEIVQCMGDLQIPFSEEDLSKPTPQRMQVVYEAFADILMGVTSDQFESPAADLGDILEHPEIHTDSALLMNFYHHICILMREVGGGDFSLRDILKPSPGRVKHILSAIINFCKFREERMFVFEKYVNQSEEYSKQLSTLQQEREDLQEQINNAKYRRTQGEPQIKKIKEKIESLVQEIKQCIHVQDALVSEVNGKRAELRELGEIDNRNQNEENELRNRINDLKSKIVQDPEKAKEELQEMNNMVYQSKSAITALEHKLRQLEIRIETMDAVEQELQSCVRLQEDCQAEEHKVEESVQQVTLDREQLEQRQIELRELELTQQRHGRQLTLIQDKLNRLEKQKSMKLDGLMAKKNQLQDEFKRATTETEVAKDKIMRNKRLTEEMEQRITELKECTNKELQNMLNDYYRLKEQVSMYQHQLLQYIS
ncbi:Nuf2 family-domain-containing protein [Dimargaris cristalligena]|uniref:Nuf2 family-domain-containing protein n=1 Tax=Dimargaris cristalligena TaxID=215637 RepID=A0A4P9ZRT6_9FUNG|nr:Nuf2 family-domain-containing protein [Dimargaris cristalligena]|eukprot:RKP36266.1 Nuf2 family-domain-containing protein [Dimargaris cristalligena]